VSVCVFRPFEYHAKSLHHVSTDQMANNTTDKGINTQKDLLGDSKMGWIGSKAIPKTLWCVSLALIKVRRLDSLTQIHTIYLSIFSTLFSKSTHYSLTLWKGRKGKMIIKSCDYDRETFASNWCVQQKSIQRGWWTTPEEHESISPSLPYLFFIFLNKPLPLQYIQTKTCSSGYIDILQWQKRHFF